VFHAEVLPLLDPTDRALLSRAGRGQGLTLVHFSAQRKHIWWDTLGAQFPPCLLDWGTRGGATKTSEVELKSVRV